MAALRQCAQGRRRDLHNMHNRCGERGEIQHPVRRANQKKKQVPRLMARCARMAGDDLNGS
jgi:hypothetical protein